MARWHFHWSDLEKSVPLILALAFAVGLLLYAWLMIPSGLGNTRMNYYPLYAKALLQGRTWIQEATAWEKCSHDLSFYQGKCYPYWGIFPALIHLLLPFLSDRLLAIFGAVLATYFLNRIVLKMAAYFSTEEKGNVMIVLPVCLALTLASGFGMIGLVGRIYEESATIATGMGLMGFFFVLPALLGERRRLESKELWISIAGFSAAGLTRTPWFPCALTVGALLAFQAVRTGDKRERLKALNQLAGPAVCLLAALSVQLLLNFSRYGQFLDAGIYYQTTQILMEPWLQNHPGLFSLRYIPFNAGIYWITGYPTLFTGEAVILNWLRQHCFYREYPGGLLVWMPGILAALAVSWRNISREALLLIGLSFFMLALPVLTLPMQIYRYQWEAFAFFAMPATAVILARSAAASLVHVAFQWLALAASIYITLGQYQAILKLQVGSL